MALSADAPKQSPRPRPLETAAYLVVVIAGMKAAAGLLVPFLIALLLAILCLPAMHWLQRRKVPASLAVLLTVMAVLALMLGVSALVGGSIQQFNERLPQTRAKLDETFLSVGNWLRDMGVAVPDDPQRDWFNPGALLRLIGDTMTGLLGVLSNIFLIAFLVIFMLFEAIGFPKKLRRALGDDDADLSTYREVLDKINQYVTVKAAVSLLTGFLVFSLMVVARVDFPLLWGLVAFAFNFIPNIGSILAAIPGVLLAFVQLGGGTAAAVAAGYLAINMVVGNALEPRIMGDRLGLSTLVVFASLVLWSWVLGPLGMLISAPLTAIVKLVLEHTRDYRQIAILLGPAVEKPRLPP